MADELASLRERGLIKQAVIFLTAENSDAAVEATESELIDGVILYWNVCQRDCSPTAWAAIRERNIPTLALRTLGGGPADGKSAEKSTESETIMREAGCGTASELALRLVASEPAVQTTIGGTASLAHLEEYLAAAESATALPENLKQKIEKLQVR